MRERRWGDAITSLERLIRFDPRNTEARVSLAHAWLGTGRPGRAIALVDSVLTVLPGDVAALQARGLFAARSGRLVEAESWWRRAFEIDSANGDSRLGLARTLRQQGRPEAAWAVLEPALRDSPWQDLRDEAAWIARVLRPRTGLIVVHEEDSDGNAIASFVVQGATSLAPRIDVRADAYVRSASFDARDRLEHSARAATVTLRARREPGWAAELSAGAAAASASAAGTLALWGAAIASPARDRVAGTVSLTRSAFDHTAPLMRSRVAITEAVADARWIPAPLWTLTGSLSMASLEGEVSGDTNRRWRLNAELRRWIQASPFSIALAWRSFGYGHDAQDGYFDPDFYGVMELGARVDHERRDLTLEAEIVPGVQRIGRAGASDGSLRATGAATYLFRRGRQLRVSAAWTNTGLQQLSPGQGDGYGYTSIGIGLAWWF